MQDLFDDMLCEEQKRLTEKQEELAAFQQSVAKLSRDLREEVPAMTATALIQQCEEYLVLETKLKETKAEKMHEWTQWKKREVDLKEILDETYLRALALMEFDGEGIPTKQDVRMMMMMKYLNRIILSGLSFNCEN